MEKKEETIRSVICEALVDIERDRNVHILFAVEAGSRAYGFECDCSDYDVRFVYTHPRDWYLRLHPGRDVIETRMPRANAEFCGWDIRKALVLLVKSNPQLLEWFASPIVYRDEQAMTLLDAAARAYYSARAAYYHYRSMTLVTRHRYVTAADTTPTKRYIHLARTTMAMMLAVAHPTEPPPISMTRMLASAALPSDVRVEIERLINERNKGNRDSGTEPIPVLDEFIANALDTTDPPPPEHDDDADSICLDTVFRTLLDQHGK